MTRERLYIYDTTLRDGAQTQGVDFSVEDKRQIALALDALGVDYIEGGWPGANPTDNAFFSERPPLKHARFTAFGMTKRAGRSAANDPGLAMVLDAKADAACLVGKTWDFHVDVALEIPRNENIDGIAESIAAVVAKGREALFDAEHFFDGYKANPGYARDCLRAAHEAGARWLVLCDTNGGTMPEEVYRIVPEVRGALPQAAFGIHAHDDTAQAVAVSLAAVRAGARQIQGTLNGLGERCGNASLCALIPTLLLKEPYASLFETGISRGQLERLTATSRLLDEILNRAPQRHAAYVGPSAFAHKGGLHSSAVQKNPRTYEHVPPESVGNARRILVSDQAGRSNLLARLAAIGIDIDARDGRLARLLEDVKQREYLGYAYDGAEASFELLARRALGQVPDYFEVESFRVMVERRHNAMGDLTTVSEAVVKVKVGAEAFHNVASGNGPVNALDQALRKDLGRYSSYLQDLHLVDYKVRILTTGTEAVTRVMVECADGTGVRWSTVGVSPNIVDASFEALVDSICYKLYRDGARELREPSVIMASNERDAPDERAGILYAGLAYSVWGIVPLYWQILSDVPPFELTVHRVFWCALFVSGVTAWRGHFSRIVSIVREPRTMATLALTSMLISCNWTLFIYCVASHQLVEASLGYYITPIISFSLGYFLLGERMSRLRIVAVCLGTVAVVVKAIGLGHIPWIAPGLALSFGFYGYFRKRTPVTGLDGLVVETLVLFPATLALVLWWGVTRSGAFPSPNFVKDALLIGGGPLTAVPLALFAAGARRMRLSTLGFMQYLSPSITLLLATLGFHESFSRWDAVAFGFVWAALTIVALEGRRFRFSERLPES